jgi:hypothetical protein
MQIGALCDNQNDVCKSITQHPGAVMAEAFYLIYDRDSVE